MTDETPKWGSPDGKPIAGHAGPLPRDYGTACIPKNWFGQGGGGGSGRQAALDGLEKLPEVSGMGVSVESATNDRQAALGEYQRDGLIESADWLEDCADCMDDEGLDRDNHARHFRAGANAIRAAITAQDVNAELLEAVKIVREGYDWQASECPKEYRNALELVLKSAEQKGGV